MKIIGIGMIGNSNYIEKSLNGFIQEVKSKEGKTIQLLEKNHINKGDRASPWIVHSKLNELDINDSCERKQMIEDLEAELTGAPKKLQTVTIWRWLKRQMLMKPSLQKPRLEMGWKLILNINKILKLIKRQ